MRRHGRAHTRTRYTCTRTRARVACTRRDVYKHALTGRAAEAVVFVQADAQADLHNCKVKRRRDRLLTERPSESPPPPTRRPRRSEFRDTALVRRLACARESPGAVGQTRAPPPALPASARRHKNPGTARRASCRRRGGISAGEFAGTKRKASLVSTRSPTRHQFPIGTVQFGRRACNGAVGQGGRGRTGCERASERAAGKKLIMD